MQTDSSVITREIARSLIDWANGEPLRHCSSAEADEYEQAALLLLPVVSRPIEASIVFKALVEEAAASGRERWWLIREVAFEAMVLMLGDRQRAASTCLEQGEAIDDEWLDLYNVRAARRIPVYIG